MNDKDLIVLILKDNPMERTRLFFTLMMVKDAIEADKKWKIGDFS